MRKYQKRLMTWSRKIGVKICHFILLVRSDFHNTAATHHPAIHLSSSGEKLDRYFSLLVSLGSGVKLQTHGMSSNW